MALENVGVVVANCARGTALVTMTSAEAELSQEAAAAALRGAGSYTLKSMSKVGEEEE
ncbi:MAG: hypothetical protein ACIAXF_15760 [Phycisphaerales bacterium JB063]